MNDRIVDLRLRLEGIAEELTEVSVEVLRTAVESGESKRPDIDKRLSQARRAVEKATRALDLEPAVEDQ